ncbi:LCP family protein [Kutzneria viridogrisea]|uniref:LCP family protein required for cell wall assembly n=1 Tax=Kutzneria viridogrisea TaxID=47990 RepID=A0ABR6BSH1_9PSEU|nr:LCP family protein required for cell wall assembly [Kutzneria viridogrisea]
MAGARGAALVGGKGMVALVSVLVLAATGYGWSTLNMAEAGVAKVDVIDKPAGPKGPGQDMNVLLVGMDSRTDAHGNKLDDAQLAPLHAGADEGEINTDTMIVVHVPGNGTAASAFSIPRDSFVTIAGAQGKDKINSAFQYGMNAETDKLRARGITDQAQLQREGMVAGRKNLVQTVENLTGVSIDHYAEVNLFGFAKISDAVGGVPVCLLQDTSDELSGANFKKGPQTVQGVSALEFVRQRHGPGLINELDRERRQQAFLASLAHQMLSTGLLTNPGRLTSVISAVQDAVVLDTNWNLLEFATQMQGLTGGSIKFNIMPVTNVDGKVGGADVVLVNPADVQAWAKALFAGTDQASKGASPSSEPSTTTTSPPAGRPGVLVDVANGSGVSGLAARVLEFVGGKGFTKGAPSTGTARSTSLVQYAADSKDVAQQVAALLGDLPLAASPTLRSGRVEVDLGKAYHGPGSAGQTVTGGGAVRLAPTATTPTTTVTPDRPEIDASGVPCIA